MSHEELRVEREPITDANRGDAYDGPAISEEEHEVTLRAERPVVEHRDRGGRAGPAGHRDRARARRPSAARSARSRSRSTTTPAPAATGAAESTDPLPLACVSAGRGELGSSIAHLTEEPRNGTSAGDPASAPLRLRSGGGVVTRRGQRDPGAAPTRCRAEARRARAGIRERLRRGGFRRGWRERSDAPHRSRRRGRVAAGRAGGGAHPDPARPAGGRSPAGRSRRARRTTSASSRQAWPSSPSSRSLPR